MIAAALEMVLFTKYMTVMECSGKCFWLGGFGESEFFCDDYTYIARESTSERIYHVQFQYFCFSYATSYDEYIGSNPSVGNSHTVHAWRNLEFMQGSAVSYPDTISQHHHNEGLSQGVDLMVPTTE